MLAFPWYEAQSPLQQFAVFGTEKKRELQGSIRCDYLIVSCTKVIVIIVALVLVAAVVIVVAVFEVVVVMVVAVVVVVIQ